MPKCPVDKNVECDYSFRAWECRRQIDFAAAHNYKYYIYENGECPVMSKYCSRLYKLKKQQQR